MKPYSVTTQNDTLKIVVQGRFDMSLCFDLWYTFQLGQGHFHTYLFDLGKVDDLRDSGIGWLMMFSHQAEKAGARIRLSNCGPDIAKRCLALGLNADPTMPRPPERRAHFKVVRRSAARPCVAL
jgi:anti-anti-sigma regulatory factor